jgi:hypothetical protein
MSKEVVLTFGDRGSVQFVYEDAENAFGSDISHLLDTGKFVTERASHVEPGIEPLIDYLLASGIRRGKRIKEVLDILRDKLPVWTADMRPMRGPVLGPFTLRKEALKAERKWLRTKRGL